MTDDEKKMWVTTLHTLDDLAENPPIGGSEGVPQLSAKMRDIYEGLADRFGERVTGARLGE